MGNRHKIVAGMREAISYAKGDIAKARVTVFNVPDSIDVKKVRESLKLSQAEPEAVDTDLVQTGPFAFMTGGSIIHPPSPIHHPR
jgi:hypothetical protein